MDGNCRKRVFNTFTFETMGRVAVFTFMGKSLFNAAGLYDMNNIGQAFRECGEDRNLKVIIVKRSSEKKDSTEYREFVRYATRQKDKLQIYRMLNFYNQFIMEVYSQDKFVISVDSGNVVSQFLSISLACDYRIVSDDTVIQKAYFHNGTVPKGGATFFLTRIVGRQRAYEILLSGKDITAAEALKMGLVQEVVPASELDAAAMNRAEEYAKLPRHTLAGIKKLMNHQTDELSKYLEHENRVVANIFEQLKID